MNHVNVIEIYCLTIEVTYYYNVLELLLLTRKSTVFTLTKYIHVCTEKQSNTVVFCASPIRSQYLYQRDLAVEKKNELHTFPIVFQSVNAHVGYHTQILRENIWYKTRSSLNYHNSNAQLIFIASSAISLDCSVDIHTTCVILSNYLFSPNETISKQRGQSASSCRTFCKLISVCR